MIPFSRRVPGIQSVPLSWPLPELLRQLQCHLSARMAAPASGYPASHTRPCERPSVRPGDRATPSRAAACASFWGCWVRPPLPGAGLLLQRPLHCPIPRSRQWEPPVRGGVAFAWGLRANLGKASHSPLRGDLPNLLARSEWASLQEPWGQRLPCVGGAGWDAGLRTASAVSGSGVLRAWGCCGQCPGCSSSRAPDVHRPVMAPPLILHPGEGRLQAQLCPL